LANLAAGKRSTGSLKGIEALSTLEKIAMLEKILLLSGAGQFLSLILV
jgi:hypothetical protein